MFELFVDQPSLDLKKGIRVKRGTEITFKNETVNQTLKDLELETIMNQSGTNGTNFFESRSHISIRLNEGDVLLFNQERGYYLPAYPVSSIPQAIEDISSLDGIQLQEEENVSG